MTVTLVLSSSTRLWPSSAVSTPLSPTHHSNYYFQDSRVTFLVESHLFRAHRFFFERESDFFKALFSLQPPTQFWGRIIEGTGDDNPIPLPGVSVREFEALLDCFYHRTQLPRDHWIHLLSISSRYDFDGIRKRAILEISSFEPPLDPVLLADLAVRHDVDGWLERAYASLCSRQHPLTGSEARRIGHPAALKIGRCRAKLIMASRHPSPGLYPPKRDGLVERTVREAFWPYGPSH